MSDADNKNALDPEKDLTLWEIKLRDEFVTEYHIDYNYIAACVRVGFDGASAYEYASRFKRDPYVQRKIKEYSNTHVCEEDRERTPRQLRIINGLMAEAYNTSHGSSHSARVAALAKLASIENLDAPTRVQTTVEHKGNVAMEFDYSNLTGEELKLVRKLLESRESNTDG